MVGCKVQIVIVVPDQVRWLRLRAVALRGVPEDPLVGEIRDILSQSIREYGLILLSQAVPGTGMKRGGHKSDRLSQSQPVHRTARRRTACGLFFFSGLKRQEIQCLDAVQDPKARNVGC